MNNYECKCRNCEFVSNNKAKKARSEMIKFLIDLNQKFKDMFTFGYTLQIVGSARNKVIFQHKNTDFDIDVQIIIQGKKCDKTLKKITSKIRPFLYNKIKNSSKIIESINQSTLAITVKKFGNKKTNFDIAVIYKKIQNNKHNKTKILKLKKFKIDEYKFECIQNHNPKCDKAFIKKNKYDIKNLYLNLKCCDWNKSKNDEKDESSFSLWIEACNNIF